MGIINPTTPNLGDPRGTGEADLRSDIIALLAEFNGNIDNANIKAGAAIDGSKLGAGTVTTDRLLAGIVATDKSIIAGTGTRTNTAYGQLDNGPDDVSVAVPANGLLCVSFQATWQESVASAARAALFIGANQLKVFQTSAGAQVTQAATLTGNTAGTGSRDEALSTASFGLVSGTDSAPAYSGDVTTGQALGMVADTVAHGRIELDGSVIGFDWTAGGVCMIDKLPAGTYTVSVQFKSSSGSVSVKDRRLRAWAMGF